MKLCAHAQSLISFSLRNLKFLGFSFLLLSFLAGPSVPAETEVFSKRAAFHRHRKIQEDYDVERENGLTAFLEAQEQWERKRMLAIQAHKNQKVAKDELRGIEAYHDYLRQKYDNYEEAMATRERYRQAEKDRKHENPSDLSESEEYDLNSNRPRYDYRKRVLYGAKPRKKNGKGSFDDFNNAGGTSTGPAPGFGGYTPAPTMQDNDFFEPPPPPPPPAFDENDFPPPPPPPPPAFDEGGEGF